MKSIQITVDEEILSELDEETEVKLEGRSSVIRRLLRQYLSERRGARIREAYQKGYGSTAEESETSELAEWEKEQVWPE
ncbi:MAG: ribbon-helix-helix protein, CopG family [Bradymonadales bacterium]|nr:ribbon-helix-helix protein, CopG family [Bradymonadales bacterium]